MRGHRPRQVGSDRSERDESLKIYQAKPLTSAQFFWLFGSNSVWRPGARNVPSLPLKYWNYNSSQLFPLCRWDGPPVGRGDAWQDSNSELHHESLAPVHVRKTTCLECWKASPGVYHSLSLGKHTNIFFPWQWTLKFSTKEKNTWEWQGWKKMENFQRNSRSMYLSWQLPATLSGKGGWESLFLSRGGGISWTSEIWSETGKTFNRKKKPSYAKASNF